MICLDFTAPETLRKLGELPYYGWAEALVRRVDPLWKFPLEGPLCFTVKLERGEDACPHCGCDCNSLLEKKSIEIEAEDADEAERLAEKQNKGWIAVAADLPKIAQASVPPEYLAWFERDEAAA
jgi:glutaredoxin